MVVRSFIYIGARPYRTGGRPSRRSGAGYAKEESVMSDLVSRTQWARFAAGAVLAGLLSVPGIALGQSLKEQIVGPSQLVSLYNEAGGTKTHQYGDKPVGLMVYDRSGYVMQFLSKPGLPKFANANRLKGTDAEYRTMMQGTLSGFGTYSVEGNTVSIKWVASSYPNRVGTVEKRTAKLAGDELTVVNPTAASGGTSYAKYVRAK
jgi:Lipocalin-like domain